MNLEVMGGGELPATPTHFALVRFLPRVYAFVLLQITSCCEFLIAVVKIAFKRVARMEPLVCHQSELSGVAFDAARFITLVWSLTRVTSLMVLQLIGCQEGLVAVGVRTFVGETPSVNANVCLEVAGCAIRPTTPCIIAFIARSCRITIGALLFELTVIRHRSLSHLTTFLLFTTKFLTLFHHSEKIK